MKMARNLFLLVFLLLILPLTATAKEEWQRFCSTEARFEQLKDFSLKIRQVEQERKTNGITSQGVEALLGAPQDKQDKTLPVEKGQEVWLYPHPCFSTVRFLLIFDGNEQLKEIKSVLRLSGKDIFYRVERYLPKEA